MASHSVTRRTREIGVRIALGAAGRDVRTLILKQSMMIATIGLGLGVIAALGFSRVLAGLVFSIGTLDVPTIGFAVVLMALVAMFATWVPAIRATRVAATETLRSE